MSVLNLLNDLALTSVGNVLTSTTGSLLNTLQGKLANHNRDTNCKFYYNYQAGGSILKVVAKSVIGGVVPEVKDLLETGFNSLLNKKKAKEKSGAAWVASELEKQNEEQAKYGMMELDEGTIYALDDWGGICPDALMLAVELDPEKKITYCQIFPEYSTVEDPNKKGVYKEETPHSILNQVVTNTLVWYDTTAIITINSDKNLITTKVQGRDYSRKELVSNGDIKFNVSGQITSGRPDIYPTQEMQKFYQMMRYKGVIKINNEVLDSLGITHIVIESFNVSCKEGYKAVQNYTFSAIGLQPEEEKEITEDTIEIIAQSPVKTEGSSNGWVDMLKNQLNGLKNTSSDLVSQGLAISSGLLDNVL